MPWEQVSSGQPSTRNGSPPVMNRGSSDPSSEAPPPPPPPPVSAGAAGGPKQPSSADQEGWRKPSKVARKASKGKDPTDCSGSGGYEPGPLAIIPARMELASSSSEAVERAMVDPESMALKRARSPSPEGPEGGRQLEVAPKKGPRPARPMRKNVKGQRLQLLPPSPPTDTQVRQAKPCMVISPEREDRGREGLSPTTSGILVNVPVEERGKWSGGSGVKDLGRRSKREGEGSCGAGGPIRRVKGKETGVSSKGEASAWLRKNKGGGGTGVRQGEEVTVGEGQGLTDRAPVSPSSSKRRGAVDGGKGCSGCGGSGKGAGVEAATPRAGRGMLKAGAITRKGEVVDSPSPGGGKGKACCRSGGKGSPSVTSPISRARSRSPARRQGNLFGGRTLPEGRKGGEDEQGMPGHGYLVELIKGAVREAKGGGDAAVEGEGGGDLGEPSVQ